MTTVTPKGKKTKRGTPSGNRRGSSSLSLSKKRTKRSKPARRRKKSFKVPGWVHWAAAALIMTLVACAAYMVLLRPYFYRWLPCQGTREYGVCIPSGYRYYGIDVSHHNGRIDWNRVAESSRENGLPIRFAIIKATEGSTFTDPDFTKNMAGARAAGLVCGAYHFYNPGTSPQKQAAHYINTVSLQKGDFVPVIDVERSGRSSADLRRELKVFVDELKSHYGVTPIIYSSAKFHSRYLDCYELNECPFWVAHYYVSRPATERNWTIWQCSDHASVDGISEYTDFNVFSGSDADFERLRIK